MPGQAAVLVQCCLLSISAATSLGNGVREFQMSTQCGIACRHRIRRLAMTALNAPIGSIEVLPNPRRLPSLLRQTETCG